ncbi:MAG: dihydrodipicolinate synthase family protein, partial [Rikenellaceae bacterium]
MMSCIETINSRYFTGAGVALVTPFDENQEIDFGALGALLDHVNAAQIDYLVVMGTTAEAPTITHQEKQAVLDFCTKNNHRNIPIVMGIGGNSTAAVIQAIESFDLSKASGILSITPYYNKPTQEGLLAHFSAIAQSSPIPIILYNVPGRTGVNMSAETTLTLAHKYPQKIVAIKEASAQINQIAKILRDRPVGFSVISGD